MVGAAPAPPVVMPGLVPGIHVGPPPRPLPARTAMPRDVDGRNKSGHDGGGVTTGEPGRQAGAAGAPIVPASAVAERSHEVVLEHFAGMDGWKAGHGGCSVAGGAT